MTTKLIAKFGAADDHRKLEKVYAEFMRDLLSSPLWSTSIPTGKRIPWRYAEEASIHQSMKSTFDSFGIYMFGSGKLIPLYVGKAEKESLGQRLFGRYLGGPESQFKLAATYRDAVMKNGIDGIPGDIQRRKSKVRIRHCHEMVRAGIDEIWIALIPTGEQRSLKPLEEKLIGHGNLWNVAHGYPLLLNRQSTRLAKLLMRNMQV